MCEKRVSTHGDRLVKETATAGTGEGGQDVAVVGEK